MSNPTGAPTMASDLSSGDGAWMPDAANSMGQDIPDWAVFIRRLEAAEVGVCPWPPNRLGEGIEEAGLGKLELFRWRSQQAGVQRFG